MRVNNLVEMGGGFFIASGFVNFICSLLVTVVFTLIIIAVFKLIPIADFLFYGKAESLGHISRILKNNHTYKNQN